MTLIKTHMMRAALIYTSTPSTDSLLIVNLLMTVQMIEDVLSVTTPVLSLNFFFFLVVNFHSTLLDTR